MKVSLIIPTYDEEDSITKTLKEVPREYINEIIVVDISTDRTAEIAEKLGCKVFRQQGRGFGGAFRQGVEHSSGDVVILMDADGSHNPKDIPKLLKKIKEGYDCVLASRYTIESHSEDDTPLRSFGNWLITNLVNLLFRINTTDSLFLYIAIKKDAYNKLNLKSSGFDYCIEFLAKAYAYGLKMAEVPSIERRRFAGRTKVNDIKHGFLLIASIFRWKSRLSKLVRTRNRERRAISK